MAPILLAALLLLGFIMYPQKVGDGLGEATRERMWQHQEYLSWKMSWLLEELEQSSSAWGALGFSALQQWQFWAIAGVLLLLLGLCWRLWKCSHELKSCINKKSSSGSGVQEGKEELEEKEKLEEEASEGGDLANEKHLKSTFVERIEWPMQKLADGSREVEELVSELIRVFQKLFSCSVLPELEPAIGVGSAFEGWSPHEGDALVFRLLLPLKPPPGHTFDLELCKKEGKPERNFRILVELECTCTREEHRENMLCFLHGAKEKLRRNQGPSFLDILCTNSYLDVHKTAEWLQGLVKSAWEVVPQKHGYNLKLLPSSRSCKLQLTNASGRTLFVELVLGVQQGNSDVFLTSQATEATFTHGTIWPESYAVAEVKFFRLMARQVPQGSFHLRCLHLFARSLAGTGFDTDTLKVVVMHLLNTTALSAWSRRDFLLRLGDVMWKLRCSVEFACLRHFFFGNGSVPTEIILPPGYRMAHALNLFEHLEQDPVAHAKAQEDLDLVQGQLLRLLLQGH